MSETVDTTRKAGTPDSGGSGSVLHHFRLELTKKQARELKAIWRKHGQSHGMILMQPVLDAGPFDLQNCFALSFVLDDTARAKIFETVNSAQRPNTKNRGGCPEENQ